MPVTSASSRDFARRLANRLDPPKTGVLVYRDDPAGFVQDCIRWDAGRGPTDYQLANMAALVEYKRTAVRGPHGLGKTATNAWIVLWFALTRDAEGADWKVPTTASVWRQLTKFLWPEIHKWARKLAWEKIGRDPFTKQELLTLNLKGKYGEAFAVASNDPTAIEGAHADQLLYVYDEAKVIPSETFDASEGAFSGAGIDTAAEAYALASSTPGPPIGRFYDIHKRKPGLEDWHPIQVTLEDTIRAKRVSREWANQRKRQWGAKSAVYLNRVCGEFATSDEDSVIPLAWVEAAMERWQALSDAGEFDGALTAVGVDVARSGGDKTVQALRRGYVISELRRSDGEGTDATRGRVEATLRNAKDRAEAVIDVIGIGAGVVDEMRPLGFKVKAFNAAAKTEMLDSSGELGFVNCRSAAWWNLREMLDPDSGIDIALPPDDDLVGDLTAPKWRVMSGGRIQVESKEDVKKRLGRSTDDGDAVIEAFWEGEEEPGPPGTVSQSNNPWR